MVVNASAYRAFLLTRAASDFGEKRYQETADRNLNFVLEPPPEGSVAPELIDNGRLRVLPQRHGTDGAFAARLRRVS